MSQITELGRVDATVYGVAFVVCRNGEVARLALELEDESEALRKMSDAGMAITDAGFGYDVCSDFSAYNGGPFVGLVDVVYYVADLYDDGEVGGWRKTWQRGAGKTEIPAEIKAKAEAVIEAASAALK